MEVNKLEKEIALQRKLHNVEVLMIWLKESFAILCLVTVRLPSPVLEKISYQPNKILQELFCANNFLRKILAT